MCICCGLRMVLCGLWFDCFGVFVIVIFVKSVCLYCGVGCGMVLYVEEGEVVKVFGDVDYLINFGWLCMKGLLVYVVLCCLGWFDCVFVCCVCEDDFVLLLVCDVIVEIVCWLCVVFDVYGFDVLLFYVLG